MQGWKFSDSYFEERISKGFENVEKYKDLYENH